MVRCDPLPMSSSISSYNSQSSINFRCPEQFGYYADEYNCSKYFVCVFGEALHESCTGGLRFSSELQTCDWPRNVVCPSEGELCSLIASSLVSTRMDYAIKNDAMEIN